MELEVYLAIVAIIAYLEAINDSYQYEIKILVAEIINDDFKII